MIIDFDADGRGTSRTLLRPRTAGDVFVILFCLWWLLLAVFSAFPQIDLAVARMFFQQQQCTTLAATPKICGYFPYGDDPYLRALREALFLLPYVVAGAICWILFNCLQHHGATYKAATARNLKVALGSLIVGPIVLVNFGLKTFSGRPRPRQTDLFGGMLDFVHAGSFAGKCVTNCSFISGEAASAGWLFCLIFIIPQPARSALALPIVAVSILTPALRVAFGGHYLSDAVLGWLSSLVVCAGLFALSQTTHSEKISKV
ncbi:phosphatase PAP2 family protein [Rhizobium tubonense]|uniref:Phosphatase n=1 Tax=Rhizobium tubonense TaxID=484088 RepID=A0A2W4F6W9_9HYPH|nr:phosphatase PAP2 family protein [Rhizobium tubonense]PZM17293.1 phosphatase [Rhizobium tubonense]